MRYIFDASCEFSLSARQKYLFEVFHVYFVLREITFTTARDRIYRYAVLQAFPFVYEPDLCIVYGHNYSISALLNSSENIVHESNVFIISCEHSSRKAFSCNKKSVYIAPQENEYAPLLTGTAFGFDFDITDAELNLFNSRKQAPKDKLHDAFIRIN